MGEEADSCKPTNPEPQPTSAISVNSVIDKSKVEKIVGSTVENGIKKYRVRWQFFGSEHDTWETASSLCKCQDLIETYESKSKLPKKVKPNVRTKIKDTSFFLEKISVANRSSIEFAQLPASPTKSKKPKSKSKKHHSEDDKEDAKLPDDFPYSPYNSTKIVTQKPKILNKKTMRKYRYLNFYAEPEEFWEYNEFLPGKSTKIQLGISNRASDVPPQVYTSDTVSHILGVRNNQGKREVNVFWATSEEETWIPLEIMKQLNPQLLVDFLLESWQDVN